MEELKNAGLDSKVTFTGNRTDIKRNPRIFLKLCFACLENQNLLVGLCLKL